MFSLNEQNGRETKEKKNFETPITHFTISCRVVRTNVEVDIIVGQGVTLVYNKLIFHLGFGKDWII